MMWTFDNSGGFIVVSDCGNWSYAYPTSPHAVTAKRHQTKIAMAMAAQSDACALWLPSEIIKNTNAYLQAKFEKLAEQRSDRGKA